MTRYSKHDVSSTTFSTLLKHSQEEKQLILHQQTSHESIGTEWGGRVPSYTEAPQ